MLPHKYSHPGGNAHDALSQKNIKWRKYCAEHRVEDAETPGARFKAIVCADSYTAAAALRKAGQAITEPIDLVLGTGRTSKRLTKGSALVERINPQDGSCRFSDLGVAGCALPTIGLICSLPVLPLRGTESSPSKIIGSGISAGLLIAEVPALLAAIPKAGLSGLGLVAGATWGFGHAGLDMLRKPSTSIDPQRLQQREHLEAEKALNACYTQYKKMCDPPVQGRSREKTKLYAALIEHQEIFEAASILYKEEHGTLPLVLQGRRLHIGNTSRRCKKQPKPHALLADYREYEKTCAADYVLLKNDDTAAALRPTPMVLDQWTGLIRPLAAAGQAKPPPLQLEEGDRWVSAVEGKTAQQPLTLVKWARSKSAKATPVR